MDWNASWYVMRMNDSDGYFAMVCEKRPDTTRRLELGFGATVAADRFSVVYGPCAVDEAETYLADVSGENRNRS